MKKIPGQPSKKKGPPSSDFLIPDKIHDSRGNEYNVKELLDKCRKNYFGITLKKNSRKIRHNNYTVDEMMYVMNHAYEWKLIQTHFGLETETQAASLYYRIRRRLEKVQES